MAPPVAIHATTHARYSLKQVHFFAFSEIGMNPNLGTVGFPIDVDGDKTITQAGLRFDTLQTQIYMHRPCHLSGRPLFKFLALESWPYRFVPLQREVHTLFRAGCILHPMHFTYRKYNVLLHLGRSNPLLLSRPS